MQETSRLMEEGTMLRDLFLHLYSFSRLGTQFDQPFTTYEQHDDKDVIIPDKIAFPLFISSHLLLVTSILCASYHMWTFFVVLFVVYLTSINHWRAPRFSSWARRLDYVAVFTSIAYGSYYATTLSISNTLIWFIGIFFVAIIFSCNEYLYYYQVMKSISGDMQYDHDIDSIKTNFTSNEKAALFVFYPTKPNTIERENVYKRTVFVHLVCVHVLANSLAMTIIIRSNTA